MIDIACGRRERGGECVCVVSVIVQDSAFVLAGSFALIN